jgi:hypothetical protein
LRLAASESFGQGVRHPVHGASRLCIRAAWRSSRSASESRSVSANQHPSHQASESMTESHHRRAALCSRHCPSHAGSARILIVLRPRHAALQPCNPAASFPRTGHPASHCAVPHRSPAATVTVVQCLSRATSEQCCVGFTRPAAPSSRLHHAPVMEEGSCSIDTVTACALLLHGSRPPDRQVGAEHCWRPGAPHITPL